MADFEEERKEGGRGAFLLFVTLAAAVLLGGFLATGYYVGNSLLAKVDRMIAARLSEARQGVKADLVALMSGPEAKKAAGEIAKAAWESEGVVDAKKAVNDKMNHLIWTYLGSVEATTGLRPQWVEEILRLYSSEPEALAPHWPNRDVEWKKYRFHPVRELEAETARIRAEQAAKEAAEKAKEGQAEAQPEAKAEGGEGEAAAQAPAPAPEASAEGEKAQPAAPSAAEAARAARMKALRE